jgi:hypothetical protein
MNEPMDNNRRLLHNHTVANWYGSPAHASYGTRSAPPYVTQLAKNEIARMYQPVEVREFEPHGPVSRSLHKHERVWPDQTVSRAPHV